MTRRELLEKLDKPMFLVMRFLFGMVPYYAIQPHRLFQYAMDIGYKSCLELPDMGMGISAMMTAISILFIPVVAVDLIYSPKHDLTFAIAVSYVYAEIALVGLVCGMWLGHVRHFTQRRYKQDGSVRNPEPRIWKTYEEYKKGTPSTTETE